MLIYETDKFWPHYEEVVILGGVFDTNWHGTFYLYQFLKLDKSHHHYEAVTTGALSMDIVLHHYRVW